MKIKIDAIYKTRARDLLTQAFEKGKKATPDYIFEEWLQQVLK